MLRGPWLLFLATVSASARASRETINIDWEIPKDLDLPWCCYNGTYGYTNCSENLDPDSDPYKQWKTFENPLPCPIWSDFDEDNAELQENGDLIVDGIRINKTEYCLDFNEGKNFSGHYCCYGQMEDDINTVPLVNQISTIISIVLLLVTAGIYTSYSRLRKTSHYPYILCLTLSLAIAYICLIVAQLFTTVDTTVCMMIGYSLQYFFLAAFFWMNAKCVNLYKKLSELRPITGQCIKEQNAKEFRRFCIYAWGVPLLISVVTYCCQRFDFIPDTQWKPDIGVEKCFFNSWRVQWVYFHGPMAAIIAANIVFFTMTARILMRNRMPAGYRIANSTQRQTDVWFFHQYSKLFLVTGLTWTAEVVEGARPPNDDSESLWEKIWSVPSVLNCLQGAFIFIFFVCQRGVIKNVIARGGTLRTSYFSSAQTTTASTVD